MSGEQSIPSRHRRNTDLDGREGHSLLGNPTPLRFRVQVTTQAICYDDPWLALFSGDRLWFPRISRAGYRKRLDAGRIEVSLRESGWAWGSLIDHGCVPAILSAISVAIEAQSPVLLSPEERIGSQLGPPTSSDRVPRFEPFSRPPVKSYSPSMASLRKEVLRNAGLLCLSVCF